MSLITSQVIIDMQRITAIKECLAHSDDKTFYESIDINLKELDKQFGHIIIGDDWFASLDEDLEIKYDIIPFDSRAKIELQKL